MADSFDGMPGLLARALTMPHAELERTMSKDGEMLLDDSSAQVVSRLLGRIVHDFNNPLAAIIGFADLLRNAGLTAEKQERYRSRIYEQAIKLSQLIENMSYFSSLPEPQVSPMNLGRVASDVFALRQGTMAASNISLHFDRPDNDVMVQGESGAVARILHSLLNNAEQVFRENPTLTQKEIRIECRQSGDGGEVVVADSGPGVSADVRNSIFAPFFSTRRSGGLGLGLSVSQGLAHRLGGSLELVADNQASLPGACFRLCLPPVQG